MKPDAGHDNNFNMIRLAAALQVMVVHAINHFGYQNWFVNAFKIAPGVPTFFFISGFLIFAAYERAQSGRRIGFFVNRILRIHPALIVCTVLALLSVYATGYFSGRGIGFARFAAWVAAQLSFFQFYNPPFMRDYGVGVMNGALWTVSVEIQFYLLVPALYFLLKQKRNLFFILAGVSMAMNLAIDRVLQDASIWENLWIKLTYVSFTPWLYMFMTGFLVSSSQTLRDCLERTKFRYLLPLYVLSMTFIGSYAKNANNGINPISFLLLAALIFKVARLKLDLPEKLKRAVQRTDFSYGIYLYHMPVINFLLVLGLFSTGTNIFLTITASLVFAAGSWYLVEKPALSHKR